MPRGVYDRSKLKKKVGRPAKTEVKQKRKYTRRATSATPSVSADVERVIEAIHQQETGVAQMEKTGFSNYELLNQLTSLGTIQTTNSTLRERIDGLMLKFADKLSTVISFEAPKAEVKAAKAPKAKVEKTVEEKVETKEEVKAEAADASEKNGKQHTVLPAPVPFIAIPTSV